jgi:hypothetical protein
MVFKRIKNQFLTTISICLILIISKSHINASNTNSNQLINKFNKLKTNNCPFEYETLNCKCKSETDLNKDFLSIQINCNLNNSNVKIIPKINTSNFQLIDYITQIDLSNTQISEIQTDAFTVSSS